jgi:hypothetical protein
MANEERGRVQFSVQVTQMSDEQWTELFEVHRERWERRCWKCFSLGWFLGIAVVGGLDLMLNVFKRVGP